MALTNINTPLQMASQQLLPKEENFDVVEIPKGFSGKKFSVTTNQNRYCLYIRDEKCDTFPWELKVSQCAASLQVSPQLISSDMTRKQMMFQYISCKEWPSFEENSKPYFEAMRLLKVFHDKAKKLIQNDKPVTVSPFSYIIERGKTMMKETPSLPKQFSQIVERVQVIFDSSVEVLKNTATFCHGDFHKDNALYDGKRVFLIDWETTSWGDPIIDVVKFSLRLKAEDRMKLYEEYLGHSPTPQEKAHFQLIDIAFLAVVVIVRMGLAYSQKVLSSELLSQSEMEQILQSTDKLPSFLAVSFADSSPKSRQKGALYALAEFLRRTDESSSFNSLLKMNSV
jgi:thiamine kinase-like enzyme